MTIMAMVVMEVMAVMAVMVAMEMDIAVMTVTAMEVMTIMAMVVMEVMAVMAVMVAMEMDIAVMAATAMVIVMEMDTTGVTDVVLMTSMQLLLLLMPTALSIHLPTVMLSLLTPMHIIH